MDERRVEQILSALPNVSVAVVGDFFLDKYLVIDPALTEVSLETGLDAHQVVGKRSSPGAAGTVTSNLCALGVGIVYAVGFTGDDGEGYDLRKGLQAAGVCTEHLLKAAELFTPTYTKPMFVQPDGREVESNRQDIKNRRPLPHEVEDQIIERLKSVVGQVHGVIIADQVQERNCGVITDRVRTKIAELAERNADVVFFADSRVRIGEFRGVMIKPNRLEAVNAVHPGWQGDVTFEQARQAGQTLYDRNRRPVFVTLSEDGLLVFGPKGDRHIPAVPVRGEIDPVGAGDSCTAGIVSSLCAGASLYEAGAMGNLVASVTVQKLGTTGTASPQEVLAVWRRWGKELVS
ncbi:MAG: bifunctional heptose 7-phosphate kinase/heptose 1-phosphate adenyltransferase [Armatimonadota bacterium]